MVVVDRDLADRARKADGQLAGRVVVAEQHVGNGVAALDAGVPGFQNGIGFFLLALQCERSTIHQHQHDRLAGGLHRGDQGALALRQIQAGSARRFVRHAARLTHCYHHHIGPACRLHCLRDHCGRRTLVLRHLGRIPVQVVEVLDDLFVVSEIGAACIDQVLADRIGKPGSQRDRSLVVASRRPAAQHVDRCISQRTDQRDLGGLRQRQGVVAVLQQHHGFARGIARRGPTQATVGFEVRRIVCCHADAHIRVLEEAHVVLGAQHFAHCVVDLRHADFARLHQARQFLQVDRVGHTHVDAGLDGELGGLALVLGDAVTRQLDDGAVVAHRDALEAPVLAQQVLHEPGVRCRRHAVDGVECHHHAARARVDGGAIWRQVVLVHAHRTHVDRVVVAPPLDRTV